MIKTRGKEMIAGRIRGHDISRIRCKGKDIWTNITPDITVFSATTSPAISGAPCYGYTQTNRTINSEYLSAVTSPVKNQNSGTTSPKTSTKTARAYVPTAKALSKYKYAIITVIYTVGASFGGANLKIGGTTVHNCSIATGGSMNASASKTTTLKFNINTAINIVSYIDNMSDNSTFIAWSNVAITQIVLTNS